MLVILFLVGQLFSLGSFFLAGLLGTAALLLYEHSLVRPDDLSRVNRAFFTVNGYVGFFLLGMTLADIYWAD
jgi:4-hydroxybenzoate polyprenyltransferase